MVLHHEASAAASMCACRHVRYGGRPTRPHVVVAWPSLRAAIHGVRQLSCLLCAQAKAARESAVGGSACIQHWLARLAAPGWLSHVYRIPCAGAESASQTASSSSGTRICYRVVNGATRRVKYVVCVCVSRGRHGDDWPAGGNVMRHQIAKSPTMLLATLVLAIEPTSRASACRACTSAPG